MNDPFSIAASLAALGRVLCAMGDVRRASRYLSRALHMAERLAASSLVMESSSALALVRLAQGLAQEAEKLSSSAIELLHRGASAEEPERIYLTHAEILQSMGCQKTAREALADAGRVLEQRAQQLTRDDYRRSFLTNVPLHQRIQTLLAKRR